MFKYDRLYNNCPFAVSPTFGFGLLDVAELVDMSERWLTVPQSISCVSSKLLS